jgi:hypothetical protein
MIVQILIKIFVGKYKDCGSDQLDNWAIISKTKFRKLEMSLIK